MRISDWSSDVCSSDLLTIERQRQGELRLHARSAGQFVLAKAPASDLPGRHVQQGELIGYVTPGHADVIRIAVPQGAIDLVRRNLRHLRYPIAALQIGKASGRAGVCQYV